MVRGYLIGLIFVIGLNGFSSVRPRPLFTDQQIQTGEFREIKLRERLKIFDHQLKSQINIPQKFDSNFEAIGFDDRLLVSFVGSDVVRDVYKLDSFRNGASLVTPWAGSYWPVFKGGIANRYLDPNFPSGEYRENHRYFENTYLDRIGSFFSGSAATVEKLAQLSPAEKYDLMTGNLTWGMTRAAWKDSEAYQDANGKVETWMGICHGWAAASYLTPVPQKKVIVSVPILPLIKPLPGETSLKVTFYPDDIKALVSQLWAESPPSSLVIGGRCNEKKPVTDSNGRIIKRDCWDINPASFHLALLNVVGKNKQSFIFDISYDFEVWNQPVASYVVTYYNPQTRVQTNKLKEAILPIKELKKDHFKKFRALGTKYVLGVMVKLNYVTESSPSANESNDDNQEFISKTWLMYDLELDGNHQVIGGEWHQVEHPDFLWRTALGEEAEAPKERGLPAWNGLFPLPMDLYQAVLKESPTRVPLNRVLSKLVEWSQ